MMDGVGTLDGRLDQEVAVNLPSSGANQHLGLLEQEASM